MKLKESLLAISLVLTAWSCPRMALSSGFPPPPNDYAAPSDLMTFTVSPNGRWISAFAADGTVLLWDTQTWRRSELISNYEVSLGADGLAFSPDSSWLVVGDEKGLVQVFKTPSATVVARMQARDGVEQFEFSGDGTRLATWNHSGISVWDFRADREVRFFPDESGFCALSLNHDGTQLFTGTEGSKIEIWDVETGKSLASISLGAGDWVNFFALDEKRRLLLSAQGHNEIGVWDLSTDTKIRDLQGHTDQVAWLRLLPGKHLVDSVSDDGSMRTWDYLTGVSLSTWQVQPGFITDGGTWMISGDPKAPNRLQVWDMASRKLLETLTYISPRAKKQ